MKKKKIRPKNIFKKYLHLEKQDTYKIFKNSRKIQLN